MLRQARNSGNAATLLHDGGVMLAGGHSNMAVVRSAELYDPVRGNWSDAGTLNVGRDPVATLLADGRVLLAGGIDWYTDSGRIYPVAEIYDPDTGQWAVTGELRVARSNHRALLPYDGRVLAVAGYGKRDSPLANAELHDPLIGEWITTGSLPSPRAWFELVKLIDGRVLTAGGYTNGGPTLPVHAS